MDGRAVAGYYRVCGVLDRAKYLNNKDALWTFIGHRPGDPEALSPLSARLVHVPNCDGPTSDVQRSLEAAWWQNDSTLQWYPWRGFPSASAGGHWKAWFPKATM